MNDGYDWSGWDYVPEWVFYSPDDDQLMEEFDNEEVEQENPEEDFWVAEWAGREGSRGEGVG